MARKERPKPKDWTRRDEAAIIDWEATVRMNKSPLIQIGQVERASLDSLAAHWRRLGIKVRVSSLKPWEHRLEVSGPRNVRRIAERVKSYLRTKKKIDWADAMVRRPILPKARRKFILHFDPKHNKGKW